MQRELPSSYPNNAGCGGGSRLAFFRVGHFLSEPRYFVAGEHRDPAVSAIDWSL